jgi:hypothetical protein
LPRFSDPAHVLFHAASRSLVGALARLASGGWETVAENASVPLVYRSALTRCQGERPACGSCATDTSRRKKKNCVHNQDSTRLLGCLLEGGDPDCLGVSASDIGTTLVGATFGTQP